MPKLNPLLVAVLIAVIAPSSVRMVKADPPSGSIVGWGGQVVGVDLSRGFVSVAAGLYHSLGLKADGSIVAWGDDRFGQTNIPAPNTWLVAVAAGGGHNRMKGCLLPDGRLSGGFRI